METKLARRLGLGALVIYGIGDILGAGIYASTGKVINTAGTGAWLTYLIAALIAIFTGLSYAELTARFPVSAGAAAFVRRAFRGRFIATIIGVMVLGTGLVSASTVLNGLTEYLPQITNLPIPIAQILLLSAIAFLSFWGIQESSQANIVMTIVEFSGLLIVIGTGIYLTDASKVEHFVQQTQINFELPVILGAVVLAFYSYIGFEDLANLAEECKNPQRDLPRAMITAIIVSTVLYLAVTLVLLINVPIDEIKTAYQSHEKSLLIIFEKAHFFGFLKYFAIIAILAITNTGLINFIMASRLMYGMSEEGLIPKAIGRVHSKRQTPWVGVMLSFIIVILLVFTGSFVELAKTTGLLIFMVFTWVHLSLIRIKFKKTKHLGIKFPLFVPIIGAGLCLTFLTQIRDPWVWGRGGIILGVGIFVWLIQTLKLKYQQPNHEND